MDISESYLKIVRNAYGNFVQKPKLSQIWREKMALQTFFCVDFINMPYMHFGSNHENANLIKLADGIPG